MQSYHRKFICAGPGGMKCSCCFPAPGKRKAEFRKVKRRERLEAMRIERREYDGNFKI